MRRWLVPLVLVLVLSPLPIRAQEAASDDRAIRQVIENAYVRGVFVARDPAVVRGGFHPDFVLSVLDDEEILVVTLDQWLDHLELDGEPGTETVEPDFERIDITGDTAVAKLQLWIDGEHVYTDYLGLYRTADGWRIVAKVFQSHD